MYTQIPKLSQKELWIVLNMPDIIMGRATARCSISVMGMAY